MLTDKTIIITGGAKNLGAAVAHRVAQDQANLVIHYNSESSAPDAEKTVAEVRAAGGEAIAVQGDLTVSSQVDALFAAAKDRFGEIWAVVNTAGRVAGSPIAETAEEDADAMIAVNTKAAFLVLRAAAREVSDGGRILNTVTSLLSAFTPGYALYAGSKASNEHYVRAMAKELAPRRISVNNVAPGPMDTPFFWDAAGEGEFDIVRSMAMGNRITRIDDIVPWFYFLLTDGAWASGQTFLVNGGFTTR
jgi:NAD(P)-dependent dehydrogenase (short-subunit alcohol dehydrogenase family)